MKRNALWVVRLVSLSLVSVVFLPACGGGGAGTPTTQPGLLWNSNSGSGGGGGTNSPQTLWVDPNTGVGGGTIGALIPSSDDITYSTPVVYIAGNTHPLMTSTSAQTIRQAEDLLMQALNGYRSQQLGGGVGAGGINGGGIVVPPTNAFLVGNDGLTRNARANAKHFSFYHPGPMDNANPEGDSVGTGGVAPAGRLAKSKITTTGVTQLVVAGSGYSDYNAAAAYFIANYQAALVDLQWTHIGCGYWTGGSEQHYWTVVLARNPMP